MGLGTGDIETPNSGLRFTLHAGDVVVHPAGTAHSNVADEGEYRYMSFFPAGSPRWKSETGKEEVDLEAVRRETGGVPMPLDPVWGGEGYLRSLWSMTAE
ncbi:hypothetical protein AWENTII_006575 [Aspergillus wentii]|nr:hypothetical protein MW887_006349 [Aspergillus wentii]